MRLILRVRLRVRLRRVHKAPFGPLTTHLTTHKHISAITDN